MTYVDEINQYCRHLEARTTGVIPAKGPNLLGKWVECQWMGIICPDCNTNKVLVKG